VGDGVLDVEPVDAPVRRGEGEAEVVFCKVAEDGEVEVRPDSSWHWPVMYVCMYVCMRIKKKEEWKDEHVKGGYFASA
jgi:hypothetical protein